MNYEQLKNIANKTLPPSQGVNDAYKLDFDTSDIIDLIRLAHPKAVEQTKKLAKSIPGRSRQEFLKNLYYLLKSHVAYKPDPPGAQWVKAPSKVWSDKECDCKSYSSFIGSVLENKGIPYKYRFVSYNDSKRPTHVYIIVPQKSIGNTNNHITMDVVWRGYNQEKPFPPNNNLDMAQNYGQGLRFVAGFDDLIDKEPDIIDLGDKPIDEMSEAEMDLRLAIANVQASKEIAESIKGIGRAHWGYDAKLSVLKDALEATKMQEAGEFRNEGDYSNMIENIADSAISGIYGNIAKYNKEYAQINGFFKKAFKKVKGGFKKLGKGVKKLAAHRRKLLSKSKTGRFLLKVEKGVKKGTKAILKTTAKIVTAPQRLIIKRMLTKRLPKASGHFLYLFIPKGDVKKFPKKVQAKRKKQQRLAKFIVDGVGLREKHFMSLVRTGIKKKFKKEPETVLRDMASGKRVAGIDENAIGRIFTNRINLTRRLFKDVRQITDQRGEKPGFDDAPVLSDFKFMRRKVRKKKIKPMSLRRLPSRIKRAPQFKKALPMLRKTGPYFLYLFINDANLLKKMPQDVRRKRKQQEEVAEFLVKNLNMTRGEFMAMVRNGIETEMRRSPESMLKAYISGTPEIGVWTAVISAVIALVKKLISLIGKKSKVSVSKSDTPSEADFQELKEQAKKEIMQEIENVDPVKQVTDVAEKQVKQAADDIVQKKFKIKDFLQKRAIKRSKRKLEERIKHHRPPGDLERDRIKEESYAPEKDAREMIVRDDFEEDHRRGGSIWDTF